MVVKRKNGESFLAHMTNAPIYDEQQKLIGIVGFSSDKSAARRTKESLRESEQRLQRMVNVPRVGVLTFDYTGNLLHANNAFLEMVGYSRAEFTAREFNWLDFTPPEFIEVSERVMESLMTTGRGGPYEKDYYRKDGSRIWMMFVASNLGDGTIVEYAVDISVAKAPRSSCAHQRKITALFLNRWRRAMSSPKPSAMTAKK